MEKPSSLPLSSSSSSSSSFSLVRSSLKRKHKNVRLVVLSVMAIAFALANLLPTFFDEDDIVINTVDIVQFESFPSAGSANGGTFKNNLATLNHSNSTKSTKNALLLDATLHATVQDETDMATTTTTAHVSKPNKNNDIEMLDRKNNDSRTNTTTSGTTFTEDTKNNHAMMKNAATTTTTTIDTIATPSSKNSSSTSSTPIVVLSYEERKSNNLTMTTKEEEDDVKEGGGDDDVDNEDIAFFHQYQKPIRTNNMTTTTTATTNISSTNNNNNNNNNEYHGDLPTKILFVHVGKTGGQSIKYALKAGCESFGRKSSRRRECFRNLLPNDNNNNNGTTALSDRVGGLIHIRLTTLKSKDADGFLVVMRHPIARSMSWYNFVNPNACVRNQNSNNNNNNNNTTDVDDLFKGSFPEINCAADKQRVLLPNGTVTRFFDCFPTANHMARAFISLSSSSSSTVTSTSTKDDNNTSSTNSITTTTSTTTTTTSASNNYNNYNSNSDYNSSLVPSKECQSLAERVWLGKIGGKRNGMFEHMEHNLRKYATVTGLKPPRIPLDNNNNYNINNNNNNNNNKTLPSKQIITIMKKPIYLVRTEHLWEDMKSTDILLGGNGNFGIVEGLKDTHTSTAEKRRRRGTVLAAKAVSDEITMNNNGGANSSSSSSSSPLQKPLLSVDMRRNMCCLLLDDMKWYRNILAWSENLPTKVALETWKDAVHECGESSWKTLQQKCSNLNITTYS